MYRSLCGHKLSSPLDQYYGAQLLDVVVRVFSFSDSKVRSQEVKWLAQSHTINSWQPGLEQVFLDASYGNVCCYGKKNGCGNRGDLNRKALLPLLPHLWKLRYLYFPTRLLGRFSEITYLKVPEVLKIVNIPQIVLFLLAFSRESKPLGEARSGLRSAPRDPEFFWAQNVEVYFLCWWVVPCCCPCPWRPCFI